MAEKTGAGDFLAGFVVGALVGAAAALLLAPQSGEETRTMIREKGIELGQRADELQIQAKAKVKQAVEEGKATATKKKEDLLTQAGKGEEAGPAPAAV